MGILDRLLDRKRPADTAALWALVVNQARRPVWYAQGGIADSVAGRFDAVTMVLALVLLRMEREDALRHATGRLTEHFVRDMDGQLRQNGIGDLVVGKHMGRLMEALGGRLGAYRAALADPDPARLVDAVNRNVTLTPGTGAAVVAAEMRALDARLAKTPAATLLAGSLAE